MERSELLAKANRTYTALRACLRGLPEDQAGRLYNLGTALLAVVAEYQDPVLSDRKDGLETAIHGLCAAIQVRLPDPPASTGPG